MDPIKKREKMPLPKLLRLGQGSRIWVRLTTQPKLAEIAKDNDAAGCWDEDTGTIWIREDLTPRQRWDTYWHEMIHAVHDTGLNAKGGI